MVLESLGVEGAVEGSLDASDGEREPELKESVAEAGEEVILGATGLSLRTDEDERVSAEGILYERRNITGSHQVSTAPVQKHEATPNITFA